MIRQKETQLRVASPCRPSCRGCCEYPCPCGYAGNPEKECTCSPTLISRHQKRLWGPLLDRIDIYIEVAACVPFQKLSDDRRGEPSAAIRDRVEAARARQVTRFVGSGRGERPFAPPTTNADMGPTEVRDYCAVDEPGRQLLGTATRQMHLSACALPPHPQFGAHHRRPGGR
jgi:magnesium chelatase family protein